MRAALCGWLLLLWASAALAQDAGPPPGGSPAPDKVGSAEVKPAGLESATQPPPGPQPPAPDPGAAGNVVPQAQPGLERELTPAQRRAQELHDDHVGPDHRVWAEAGFLIWWIKSGPLPVPLLTTGSPEGTGIIGDADTRVLLGNSEFDFGRFSGGRFLVGGWLNDCHVWGVEAGGFVLEQKSTSASFASDASGLPLLARPFNDANSPPVAGTPLAVTPSSILVSAPLDNPNGSFTGSFSSAANARLWGLETNIVRNLCATPTWTADLLFGFRYLDLEEDLRLTENVTALPGSGLVFNTSPENPQFLPDGSSLVLFDRFHTRNQFYGGQFGGRFEGRFGKLTAAVTLKVALGPNHETIFIDGQTTAVVPGQANQSLPSGFLAVSGANTGSRTNNFFAIMPSTSVQVGYQITEWLRAFVGYDFLYLNEVARPGNQINLNVNTGLLPSSPNFGNGVGPAEPRPLTKREDFWAQGVQLGVALKY